MSFSIGLVMKDDDTRRLLNAKLTTDRQRRASLIELLYPTIYKFSCLLDLRFFPFDVQVCTMTFSSWTYDQKGIDYFPYSEKIGTSNYLENEGWYILKTKVTRNEVKYSCCPNKYTLLQLTLYLRRKPLFYLVNLIIPTSIITLIAIVGFFTTSSASGMREEKVSLGITTLLSMSILMLMVSDQMPTTSTFIPLIGWFILAMIIVISLGTIVSSIIIAIQKRGSLGERLSKRVLRVAKIIAYVTCTSLPSHIEKEQMMLQEAFDAPTPTVDMVKPLKTPSDAQKRWMSIRRAKNGIAVVSDKSSDPLIHLSNPGADDPALPGMTPMATLPPGATCDDDLSLQSDMSSRPTTGRVLKQNGKSNVFSQMQASVKHNRQLAVAEFEWLASVVERSCFVIFVLCFLFITVGINFIGFLHWYSAGVEYHDD
ncbi:Neurotransmitter-gated ion-channel transmembrane region [Ancylostoma duodenale]|uniref:Neurotransmitter-gated ion-channel transmembrane region n=2 Tax=Ancylostoma duodenale TaxID=51022 RepID=A0A0C2GDF9_9BILA|nr:Neurotransmitter-gated ion-channel transmembrane region [Ancylostoma duodenale]